MRRTYRSCILPLCLGAALVTAVEVVYVTDLSIFTELAPCAASALSENIQSQTYDNCPEAVTDLQSCVCTKNQNLASIATAISKSVSWSCGATASEDQASASTVLSAYCNQNSIPTFPTPATPVSVYITDVPEISYLAKCASYAVSEAVQTLTYEECPPDATALATCACSKNQNSLKVSQLINSSAKYSCSSHTADIASAQAIFAAYCNLNNGTSDFPTPTNPPGDMTYYVTALTQYASLAPCAKSGLSYAVFSQTYEYCPGGPQALASCACIKESISGSVTSSISSNVKYSCSSTATEDVASAIAVFDFYCSAARAEVVATGVTDSVAQSSPTASAGSGGGSGSAGSKPTAATTKHTSTTGTSNSSSTTGAVTGGDEGHSSGPKGAVIGGAIAGAVVALLLIGSLIWYLRHHNTRSANAAALAAAQSNVQNQGGGGGDYEGKPELAGNPLSALPPSSPSPSTLKPNAAGRVGSVSPVSAHGGSPWGPPTDTAELHGQGAPHPPMPPNAAELAGQAQQGAPYPRPNQPELSGTPAGYPLQPLQPNRPELAGQQGYPQGYPQPYPQGPGYPIRAQEYNSGYGNGQQYPPPQEAYGQPVYEFPGQQQGPPYQQPQPQQPQPQQPGWGPLGPVELHGQPR